MNLNQLNLYANQISHHTIPKHIQQLYTLAIELLSIAQNQLRYFPNSIQPYAQTFYKLIELKLQSRQKRQQQAKHVASAYFRCIINQQFLLYNDYHEYLSKIHFVPQQIKILEDLFQLKTKIMYSLRVTSGYQQIQSNNVEMITPTNLLKVCKRMMEKFSKINHKDPQEVTTLDQNQIKLHKWKYESCYICCSLVLQKQLNVNTLSFIKLTNKLMKQCLIADALVYKLYIFFIENMIKCKNDNYGHFQIQLQRIKKQQQKRPNYSQQINNQIQLTLQKARQYTKKKLQGKDNKILKEYEKNNHTINLEDVFKKKAILNRQSNQLTMAIEKRKFMYRNFQSTTILKIKSYHHSLRNTFRDTSKKTPRNNSSHHHQKQQNLQKKSSVIINAVKGQNKETYRQEQQCLSGRIKLTRNNSNSISNRKYRLKLASRQKQLKIKKIKAIYLSVRDNGARDLAITTMGLQNQMFMIPDYQTQKPKITFKQILIQTKVSQKSQANTYQSPQIQSELYKTQSNQQILITTQVQLTILFIMNDRSSYFKIIKKRFLQNQYSCFIIMNNQIIRTNFEDLQQSGSLFNFAQIKKLVTSSELYFQLIQQSTDLYRLQSTLNLIVQSKQLQSMKEQSLQQYNSHLKLYTNILQISNFIAPYFQWYYTKQNKMNGNILSKRKNVKISDTLKFSIGLQFLKRNSYQDCIHSAKKVRNKKGLRQCLIYLSQGRQILLKIITKFKGKHVFNILWIAQNTFYQFLLGQDKDLFAEIFFQNRQIYLQNFKTKKACAINPRHYFKDSQCNQILIRNTKENFINKKYLYRLIRIIQNINQAQRRQYEFQYQNQDTYNKNSILYNYKQDDGMFSDYQTCKISLFVSNDNQFQVQFKISPQLKNFVSFLLNFSQVYENTFNYQIVLKKVHNIKIQANFFSIQIYELFLKTFLIVLKANNSNCSFYVFILTQKQLGNINIQNSGYFKNKSYNNQSLQSSSFVCHHNLQTIFQRDSALQLSFYETQYYNKLGIKIFQHQNSKKQFYLLNLTSKGIIQPTFCQHYQVILKKIFFQSKKWIYICVSLNFDLFFWRIDIYLQSNQEKYVAFIPYQICEQGSLSNKQQQNDHFTPYYFWNKIILQKRITIQFEKNRVKINQNNKVNEFLLYETFGVLNLHSNDFKTERQETVQLLLCDSKIEFLLLDYENVKILMGEVDENPLNLFTNIFAEYSQKQFKVKIYNNIFVRVFNRILTNKISYQQIEIKELQVQKQQNQVCLE